MTKRDLSYLRTPEVQAKRIKSLKRSLRRRKKLAAAGTNVVSIMDIPGERPPILKHAELLVAPRRRARAAEASDDRVELTKGIVALLFKALGGK